MGEMSPRHPAYGRGVDFLKQFPPQKGYFDMYYYYYATQVVHFYEGPDWHKFWNPKMRDLLIDLQRQGRGGRPARQLGQGPGLHRQRAAGGSGPPAWPC